jgi:hypothetical protein
MRWRITMAFKPHVLILNPNELQGAVASNPFRAAETVPKSFYRARSRIQQGTKRWDRILLAILLPAILAILPVAVGFQKVGTPSA